LSILLGVAVFKYNIDFFELVFNNILLILITTDNNACIVQQSLNFFEILSNWIKAELLFKLLLKYVKIQIKRLINRNILLKQIVQLF